MIDFEDDILTWRKLGFVGGKIIEVYEGYYKWIGTLSYATLEFTVLGTLCVPDEKRWIAQTKVLSTGLHERHAVVMEEGMCWFGQQSEQFTFMLKALSDGKENIYFRALSYKL